LLLFLLLLLAAKTKWGKLVVGMELLLLLVLYTEHAELSPRSKTNYS
jgi:hypothetical protein